MSAQSYANQVHRPKLFAVGFFAWVAAVVGFGLAHFGYHTHMWVSALLLVAVVTPILASRVYVVALQDRIIKLEMQLRTQTVLSPAQQAQLRKLSNKQIVALRFASDAELPTLLERVVAEQLTPDQIKRAVRDWQPDLDRT